MHSALPLGYRHIFLFFFGGVRLRIGDRYTRWTSASTLKLLYTLQRRADGTERDLPCLPVPRLRSGIASHPSATASCMSHTCGHVLRLSVSSAHSTAMIRLRNMVTATW